jgi:hypothetical protein
MDAARPAYSRAAFPFIETMPKEKISLTPEQEEFMKPKNSLAKMRTLFDDSDNARVDDWFRDLTPDERFEYLLRMILMGAQELRDFKEKTYAKTIAVELGKAIQADGMDVEVLAEGEVGDGGFLDELLQKLEGANKKKHH